LAQTWGNKTAYAIDDRARLRSLIQGTGMFDVFTKSSSFEASSFSFPTTNVLMMGTPRSFRTA
jgi:hypothetical protein